MAACVLARVLRVLRVRALVLVRVLRVLRVRALVRAACAACASTRAVVLVLPRTLGLTGTPPVRVLVVRVRRT